GARSGSAASLPPHANTPRRVPPGGGNWSGRSLDGYRPNQLATSLIPLETVLARSLTPLETVLATAKTGLEGSWMEENNSTAKSPSAAPTNPPTAAPTNMPMAVPGPGIMDPRAPPSHAPTSVAPPRLTALETTACAVPNAHAPATSPG